MKLIVQIPCYNEEHTLPQTVADIPREIEGIEKVEILIIDDGCTDRTVEIARELGIDHIIQNKTNMGLARTFRNGLEGCLNAGADIIVNTDGDNQYCGQDIPKLIKPIIDGQADIVIGDRQTAKTPYFSFTKKALQRLGSRVVCQLSGISVPDAVSGFRAISKQAALRLNIISTFSYTTEMIIQAGKKHLAIVSVPVRTNPKTRESRLFKSIPRFIERQLASMLRMYAMFQPLRFFIYISLVFGFIGLIPIARFLFFYFTTGGGGHIQSLVLGGTFLMMGFVMGAVALVADLISHNRQLLEMTLEKVRRIELSNRRSQKNRQD